MNWQNRLLNHLVVIVERSHVLILRATEKDLSGVQEVAGFINIRWTMVRIGIKVHLVGNILFLEVLFRSSMMMCVCTISFNMKVIIETSIVWPFFYAVMQPCWWKDNLKGQSRAFFKTVLKNSSASSSDRIFW